jgi:DNA-binding winged helix-turn-helix (wHTH) protein
LRSMKAHAARAGSCKASKTSHVDRAATSRVAQIFISTRMYEVLMPQNALATVDRPAHEQRRWTYSHRAAVTAPLAFLSQVEAAGQSIVSAATMISFGPFHILPRQRLLLEGDLPLRLGSRAFDILVVLVERAGGLVGKDELQNLIWPGTFVSDNHLKVQVATLRRTLWDGEDGNRYISTVAGRCYWFVAPVVRSRDIVGGP